MASFLDVTALDIDSWAGTIASKSIFPELVRRLILATSTSLTKVDFPSGDATYEGGWDGIVVDEVGSPFIPKGQSGWELGTTSKKKDKAESDYAERSGDSRGLNQSETTIVLVTPRNWGAPDKRAWVKAKKDENIWKDVILYDAKDLETWLSVAPSVQVWFSSLIGKRPSGVFDLDNYWLDWSHSTEPATTASLVTAGRESLVKEIHGWLSSDSNSFSLLADSRTEAVAVLAAAIQVLPSDERLAQLGRCIVVNEVDSWHKLVNVGQPLTLVPLFDDKDAVAGAYRRGHKVFLPLDRTDKSRAVGAREVPRLSRFAAESVLISEGIGDDSARKLARIARRSFSAFRRAIAVNPYLHTPDWAKTESQQLLIAALLIGVWDENNEADKEGLSRVAHLAYHELKSKLVQWSNSVDPPVRLVGTVWYVVDKEDIWNLVMASIAREQLDAFTATVLDALSKPLGRYVLTVSAEASEGAKAADIANSGLFRDSLTNTLALLGAYEEQILPSADVTAGEVAKQCVRQLFAIADSIPGVWPSIGNLLPSIAEAAPDEFLNTVSSGIQREGLGVKQLFEEQETFFYASSDHAGLLWALEVLAWNSDYLSRATQVLAMLVRLGLVKVGGNKPFGSLYEIFLLWMPHTAATAQQRLEVIDLLRTREPDVSWSLLKSLILEGRGVSTGTAKPKWRDWVPASQRQSRMALYEAAEQINERLLTDAGTDVGRWVDLIEKLPSLSGNQLRAAIQRLKTLVLSEDSDKAAVWHALRQLVARHRSFADTEWAMSPAAVDDLADVMPLFEPQGIIERYAWLFDTWPALPEGKEQETKEYEKTIFQAQSAAMHLIYKQGGTAIVETLIQSVRAPQLLGKLLFLEGIEDTQSKLLVKKYVGSNSHSEDHFGQGIIGAWIRKEGSEWALNAVDSFKEDWAPIQLATWLYWLPSTPNIWAKAHLLGDGVEEEYWKLVSPYSIEEKDVEQAVNLFMQFNLSAKAVELLGQNERNRKSLPTDLLLDVLERAIHSDSSDNGSTMRKYYIENLLEELGEMPDIDRVRVARLEFLLMAQSYSFAYDKKPKVLFDELSKNPILYSQLIAIAFRPEGVGSKVVDSGDANLAIGGWRLLEHWRTLPGLQANGEIDAAFFFDWVEQVLALTSESGHKVIAEQQLGQLISGSPVGKDGNWPHESVRDLLEAKQSEEIETGFQIGIHNSRGTTSRGAFEGGEQERELVGLYSGYAEALKIRWPRTATVLKEIAGYFSKRAQEEDKDAELRQDFDG
ncbi:hypothetical protein LGH70_22850 [Hymenobacter sp. BT635]|uniref:ATP-binding protein n=1 Tax=Hymenobacter nitidus TaxID=2880929 RepID=A0ABS8AML4_9BACT|nr:hypothetical protein [Hymenobacter nitidus]MCB2380450.1 hypothetical protein [Hymenobacter nitidus]